MEKEQVKSNTVIMNEDEEVECKRNLLGFRGINSVVESKKVKKKNINIEAKTQEDDAKRQNALAEKWKTLQNQKCTIANALKGESFNNKIKFDEDGDQEHKEYYLQTSKKKVYLFDDDDDDNVNDNQENLISDFKLKLRFEGKKGKKLFHMQTSKVTGDDRFVMDKRFFDEQETTEIKDDNEIEKQMNILEDVVGRSITKPKKDNEDQIFNMVRYDPTQGEHKKYLKDKPELPKQKRQKKQKDTQIKIVAQPVVDTNKYYKVGDKLKDVFSTQNQFSLTSLFHTSNEIDNNVVNNEEYQAEKITKPQKIFGRNPFRDDSSDSDNGENDFEDVKENVVTEVPSEKILGSRGVWRETFFFKIDDSRFKDAEEFYDPQYNNTNYTGSQDPRFIKKRDILRDFLKNKNKRHKRELDKKMFSRKLGGTHQKSHKNKPEKYVNKSKRRKNVKLTETR